MCRLWGWRIAGANDESIYCRQLLSQRDPRDALLTRIVLYAAVNPQCYKLAPVVGQTPIVASTANLIRPTTVQFVILGVHLFRTKLTTRCYDRRAVAKFSMSRNSRENTVIFRDTRISLKQSKHRCKNQLDPSSRFYRTPTCGIGRQQAKRRANKIHHTVRLQPFCARSSYPKEWNRTHSVSAKYSQ